MIVERINITKTSIKRTFSMIMALLMIITSLSVSAFAVDTSGKNFDYYIEDGEVTILDNYCSDKESITIPEKIEGYPVTIIAEESFAECKASEITIPETVVQICYSAFYGCQNLKNITIPDSVTSLGDSAFNNCTGLTSVSISNNIKEIGEDAFINCIGLTSVTIPDSVTSIGWDAFKNCTGLTSVSIGNGVTSIGDSAFYNCTSLASITVDENNPNYSSDEYGVLFNKDKTELIQYPVGNIRTKYKIPDSVTSIGYRAFYGCTGLTSITIPDSVTSIGYRAFYGCTGLTSITIPNSVTSIGYRAFYGCTGLTSITIPDSVTSIGEEAFYGCTGLTNVTIGNGVTSIGNSAFYHCTGLTSITIPDSVTSIGGWVFYGCSGLNNIKIGNGIKEIYDTVFHNTGYYNNEENWVDGVLYIDNCLIKAKTDISGECSIKDGTRIIADRAFEDCRNLTGITIPGSVKYISRYAFSGCSSLSSATLENGIVGIEDSAFRTCINLASISIPDSVEKIGTYAFYGCLNLKTISIGSGIKSIEPNAFAETGYFINKTDNWVNNVLYIDNCLIKASFVSGEYTIKDGTTVISDSAFSGCSSLTSITIPNSVTSIGDGAFEYCDRLTSVTIGNGVTSIGDGAFKYCDRLTSVTIGNGVTSIGDYAFEYCYSLTRVMLPNSVTSIGDSAFYNCTGLTSVTIGNSVTSIGDWAFYNCTGLTSVTIGNSVTSIGDWAFSHCTGLTSVTIPDSVTSIGDSAFCGCDRLTSITVDVNNPNYSSDEYGVLFNKDKTELIQYPIGNERTEYIIPNSVTSIGYSAFYNCTELTGVTIGNSVTSIGDGAFFKCTGLTSITVDVNNPNYSSDEYGVLFNKDKTEFIQYPIGNERTEYIIPNSVTSIGYSAFYNCTGLTNVTIGNGVTSIGGYAFYKCTGLTSVTIPNSVTRIGEYAFSGCTGLTSVTIGNGVTRIGEYAFSGCTGLTSVKIPNSVTYIDGGAFSGCTSLVVDSLPRRLIAIGYGAFENCEGLVSITIHGKVKYIASNAFSDCVNLESFLVDESNQYYSSDDFGVLFNKDKTRLMKYPIGNARTSYTVPETVQTINNESFQNCKSLVSITIPKSVSSIYFYAFYSCDNLNTVYYSGSPSMWSEIWIYYGNDSLENATIIYAEEDSESGETVEAKKETVADEATDVSVEYISNFHNGEVGLSVERTFDGKAFDVISTQLDINSNEIYDIKMTVDGVVTQPNGKVKVKIPIPAGYDPAKTFVYHVNTNTGTVENMNAVVEGNYLVFETDHFSYYAVVEVKDSVPDEPVEQSYKITWNIDGRITEQKYKAGDVITVPQNPVKSGYRFVGWSPAVPATMPAYDLIFTAVFEKLSSPAEDRLTVSIRTPSTASIDYGDSIILHLDIDRPLPDGAYIEWSESNGNFDMSVSSDGTTCKISPKSNGKTVFTATVYDKDGNVISSDTQEMTAKAGFFDKIVAFFKKIFGLTKTIPELFKVIF